MNAQLLMFIINYLVQCVETCTELLREELQVSEQTYTYYTNNKTRHSYICIYVAYSRPNDWTDWAEIFCGHSCMAGGFNRLKNRIFFIFLSSFFQKYLFFPRATPGLSASII